MNTPASSQYAVWVEDSNGNLIRTLYVSDFIGNRRGYERRKDALKHWVSKADPQNISDTEHPDEKISVLEERSEPDNQTNETMIENVQMNGITE